ncbi:MAG: M1 family peptidase, partial [Caulobacter sp.]|nr:M1 family peptidase [Caulobacter sp.]
MSVRIRALAACAASLLTLSATTGASGAEPLKTSALSLETGGPMPAEQQALSFDHADLKFKILPDKKAIEGEATLTFTAKSPLDKLVLDFDRVFAISKLTIDGKTLKPSSWTNPEGRMTITLPRRVSAGKAVTVAITYAGVPLEAKRAPWDGGFVWSKTPTGERG